MFKKPIQLGSKKELGKKECKAVTQKLFTAEDVHNDVALTLCQVQIADEPGSSLITRKDDNQPLAYCVSRDKSLLSLYSIWEYGSDLPFVFVNSAVSSFVLGGAHLMLPGVIRHPRLPVSRPFKEGDLLLIFVLGNPLAFAIGSAEMPLDVITACSPSAKGKAVSILHYFGDSLWQLGSRYVPPGFLFEQITAVSDAEASPPIVCEPSSSSDTLPQELTTEETDILAMSSFFFVAKSVCDADVPMNASALYSRMQAMARLIITSSASCKRIGLSRISSGARLDLKTSSWGQLRAFLDHLVARNFLSLKSIRGEVIITSVASQNPAVVAFIPPVVAESKIETSTAVDVKIWFSVAHEWLHVLGASGVREGTKKELNEQLAQYLRQFKGSEAPVSLAKISGPIEKKILTQMFNDSLVQKYSISTELPPRVRSGPLPVVSVSVKRIQGNHVR